MTDPEAAPVESYWVRRRRIEREANARAALRPPPAPPTTRQLEQWTELKNIIFDNGGAVVSPPGSMRIRFNCEADSPIPDYLRAQGHSVVPAGTAEVLLPIGEGVGPKTVHVYELEIQK